MKHRIETIPFYDIIIPGKRHGATHSGSLSRQASSPMVDGTGFLGGHWIGNPCGSLAGPVAQLIFDIVRNKENKHGLF